MPDQIDRRSMGNMERHLQTILITFITGSVIFAANYFFTDREAKAVLLTNLTNLTAQVGEMRADLRTLRAEQAKQVQVEDIERRLREVERAVAARGANGRPL